jgi:hypothetical protein
MANAAWPLGLTNEDALALVTLPNEAIQADRYPLSPRIRLLRGIEAKLPMAPPILRQPGRPRPRNANRSVRRGLDHDGMG